MRTKAQISVSSSVSYPPTLLLVMRDRYVTFRGNMANNSRILLSFIYKQPGSRFAVTRQLITISGVQYPDSFRRYG